MTRLHTNTINILQNNDSKCLLLINCVLPLRVQVLAKVALQDERQTLRCCCYTTHDTT